jgi:hypothetical protein
VRCREEEFLFNETTCRYRTPIREELGNPNKVVFAVLLLESTGNWGARKTLCNGKSLTFLTVQVKQLPMQPTHNLALL